MTESLLAPLLSQPTTRISMSVFSSLYQPPPAFESARVEVCRACGNSIPSTHSSNHSAGRGFHLADLMPGSAGNRSGKKVSHSKSGSDEVCCLESVAGDDGDDESGGGGGGTTLRTWVCRMRTSKSVLSPSPSVSVSVSESIWFVDLFWRG